MKLLVEFELDESWEAYITDNEERLNNLVKSQLEGVKTRVVENLDLQNVTNWVAVKDKLPNHDQNVLVYNLNHIALGYVQNEYSHNPVKLEKREFKHCSGLDWEITHWCELPKPPCL